LTDQQVREAHDSIKPGVGEAEPQVTGQLRTVSPRKRAAAVAIAKTLLPDPLPPAPRAWTILRDVFPGAYAPGFMLSCASRTCWSVKYVNAFAKPSAKVYFRR